ncbi:MAG: lysophospholipid acyltransferase family protein [Minwuia sp.]|uniref:lysophospholipid acyltransferase family protein n=1 Tax=Minwuia sp. TaxID=2493630 RepID=UPI003A8B9C2A
MTFIRTLLFNIWFWLWSAVMNVAFLPALLLPRRVVMAGQRVWAMGLNWGLRHLVGLRWTVRGRGNLLPGPVIIACKHQSMWDTIIWHIEVDDPAIVMKKELLRIPVYGWYCRHTKQIPIDRAGKTAALKDMLVHARAARDASRHLIIFPQGTRMAPGEKRAYLPGVAALYRDLGLPVVPVALNSGLFWGRNAFTKKPGEIVLEYLEPIPAGLPRKEFMSRLEDAIESATDALEAEAGKSSTGRG